MGDMRKLTTKVTSHVNIRSLKAMIIEFPNSALRDLILSDPDVLSVNEFILKTEIWLKLLKFHSEGKHHEHDFACV